MKFDTKKSLFILLFFAIGITSCREGNSIYNPEYEPSKADPVITSITPEDGYLSGIDSIIVHGENFSDDVDEMTISFDGQTGTILSATPTKLGVRPAQIIGDEIEVRVSSRGAINFSNTVTYKLEGAINSIPGYNQTHNSTGITRNADGDIIFSLQNESGANQGIKVWRVNNDVEDYLPSSSNWVAMKIGPDGLLYAVRGIYAVYRENNGGIDNSPYAIGDPSESYRNLDFGVGNYLWVVGDNEDIIRADISDGSIERFGGSEEVYSANLRAVRYYNDQLFVAGSFEGTDGTTQQIWSFDVNDNSLSAPQHIFTIEEESGETMQILEITFDEDGIMYLGSTIGSGIYTWSEEEGFNEMYPGLIKASGFSFTWLDNFLVASITNNGENTRHPTKIDIRKEGAPYLGITN